MKKVTVILLVVAPSACGSVASDERELPGKNSEAVVSVEVEAGAFDGNVWRIDSNGNLVQDAVDETYLDFGDPGDIPFMASWGFSRCTTPPIARAVVYRPSTRQFYVDDDRNGVWSSGDLVLGPLIPPSVNYDDRPFLWKRVYTTSQGVYMCRIVPGIFRTPNWTSGPGTWYIDEDANGTWSVTELSFQFGHSGDLPAPIRGTFQSVPASHSKSVAAVFRSGEWYVDKNGNNEWDHCDVDGCGYFGAPGWSPMTHPALAYIGVRDAATTYIDTNKSLYWDGEFVDGIIQYATSGQTPIVFNWYWW